MVKRISPGAWIALLFVLCGLPFLRLVGLHADASDELTCFYPCSQPSFHPNIFGFELPVMVLPYLGAFKAWLYLPILYSLEITAVALRLPLLLVAAVSVFLFFLLLDWTVGRTAAIGGSLLLATDASFAISSALDFGPVVFLHFFLLAGALLLIRFDRTRSPRWLALAFFLFGLALWHKALFVWMLGALAAGGLAAFPRRLWSLFSARRLALAAVSFCVGGSPLLVYNLSSRGATLRTGEVLSATASLDTKLTVLGQTLDGSAMMRDHLIENGYQPASSRRPTSLMGTISSRLASAVRPQSNWILLGLVASVCLLPWLWMTPARPAAVFAMVYLVTGWALMAALPNTGAAVHHVILLWPLPHFLMAVAGAHLAQKFGRRGVATMSVLLTLMAGYSVLLVNRYAADLITRGPSGIFTDAVYPLSDYLAGLGPRRLFAVDWGYADTLCLLSDGEIDIQELGDDLRLQSDPEAIRIALERPRSVFIGRVQRDEQFPGVHAFLNRKAEEWGYSRQILQVIEDRHGRPRFEVLRFVPK